MANGKVEYFNETAGYGLISSAEDDGDIDEKVLFYIGDFGGPDIEEGTVVEFDLELSPRGPRAWNVRN